MSDPFRPSSGDPLAPGDPLIGYTSPPPPGAGGPAVFQSAPVAQRWQLSGWWRRVGASIIDSIVITIGATLLLVLVTALFGSVTFIDETAGAVAVIFGLFLAGLVVVVAALIYAPWMMAKTNGKTLGRMAVGIRVVRADGQTMTFGFAALREVVVKWLLFNVAAGLVTFGIATLLDVLWPLWDEENRALHDMVVNTRVIRD